MDRALASLLLAALCCTPGASQRSDERQDPFTAADPEAMQQLGVVAYAPLPWADGLRTEDVEKVLGRQGICWLETPHFCIGSTLAATRPPQDAKARKILQAELGALNDKSRRLPKRASRLSPWLRTHLFAHRAEALYAEIAALVGHADAATHLGQQGKLLVLLFQERSDLARYSERFCDRRTEVALRHLHAGTGQRLLALTVEDDDGPKDPAALHAQFRYMLTLVLMDAAGGAPYWLANGLAHHYERQVPSNLTNCVPKAGEHVDPQTQHLWEQKLGRRLQHEELAIPFHGLATNYDLGYHGHLQAWSRVEYLMQLDGEKFAALVRKLDGSSSRAEQARVLGEVYGIEPHEFDEQWREWALRTY